MHLFGRFFLQIFFCFGFFYGFSMILRGMQKSLQNLLTEALLHDNMNT